MIPMRSKGSDKRKASTRRPAPGPEAGGASAPPHRAEDYDSTAKLFRALSHPLRVQLVCGLLQEPLSQTGIARVLGLSQSLVAQHLAVLRRCGMVRGERRQGEVVLEVADRRLPGIFAAVCEDAGRMLSMGWEGIARRRSSSADRG